jgi:hypothetical protein
MGEIRNAHRVRYSSVYFGTCWERLEWFRVPKAVIEARTEDIFTSKIRLGPKHASGRWVDFPAWCKYVLGLDRRKAAPHAT